MFLSVFEIPLRSLPPIGLATASVKHPLTRGKRVNIKKLSTIDIITVQAVLIVAVLEIAPPIIPRALIKGINALITLQSVLL